MDDSETQEQRAERIMARERHRPFPYSNDGLETATLIYDLTAECAKLRAEAANSAAQRDEAVLRATKAEDRLRALEADLAELDAVFDLQWQADMRAVTEWRRKKPGNDLVLPDGCSLAVWALQQLDEARAELARRDAAERNHTAAGGAADA
jgi:hypothetical protein